MLVNVIKNYWVLQNDLNSGAKLIQVYDKNGSPKLKRGRFCFYDTKWKTVY